VSILPAHTFSALPRDVLSLVASKLCPGARAAARLACKDLDSAVLGSLDEMDVRAFLRHAGGGRLGPILSVRRPGVSADMRRQDGVPGDSASPGEDTRARAESLANLFGVTLVSPDSDADSPDDDLGTWAHVTPDRWKMVGLDVADPRPRQAALSEGLLSELESLSVRANSSRSSRRGQALAAAAVARGNVRRLRLSFPGWPGSAVFSELHRCRSMSVIEIISTARAESEAIRRNLPAIAECGALKTLRLRWSGRGEDAVASLCAAVRSLGAAKNPGPRPTTPSLTELDIDCDLRDGSTLALIAETFPALKKLTARRIECGVSGIAALSRLKGLERLELSGRMASAWPKSSEPLDDDFPALREAFVTGCGASESELGWLARARRLRTLDASDNTLTSPPALHPEARLTHLDLSWNYLGYRSAVCLAAPEYSSLRFLDVSNNKLLDYGAVLLARSVGRGGRLPLLESLTIHHNRLSTSGAVFLRKQIDARLGTG
jgi:Leucine-rich repeat (LRR) protein